MKSAERGPALGAAMAALLGVLAAASALGIGHLVAGVVDPHSSPYLAVGNTAIDLTPEAVKQFAIRLFGTSDKLALLVGMGIVLTGLALVAGLLSRRRRWPGVVVIAVFGAIGIAAALARPDLGASGLVAPAVATAVGIAVFAWLHHVAARLAAARRESTTSGSALEIGASRRLFLRTSAGVAVTAGVTGLGGQFLADRSETEQSRRALGAITPPRPAPGIPSGADFASSGTPAFITPNPNFYRVDTALSVPRIRADEWRLRVHGMVERELNLTFGELRRRRIVERTITMTCVSNPVGGSLISTANFVGVPIRDLLLEAGVRPGAEQVFSTSVDGFTAGTPLDVLMQPDRDALLAIGMNRQPLPAEHGFPVRMVTPGLYGFLSATKWLTDLKLTTFDEKPYWAQRGWAQRAPIKTESRIDRPRPQDTLAAGRITAAGIAWAQHTGIDHVDVRMDGGAWQRADLSQEVNVNTWRMWRIDLDVAPGNHTLECRATDQSGYTQTPKRVDVVPDGATGWHSVSYTAR